MRLAHLTSMSKVTNTQKELLSEDTVAMIEAGFLSSDLKITDDLRYFLEHLNLKANLKAVVVRAKEKAKEMKKDCKPCDDDAE